MNQRAVSYSSCVRLNSHSAVERFLASIGLPIIRATTVSVSHPFIVSIVIPPSSVAITCSA